MADITADQIEAAEKELRAAKSKGSAAKRKEAASSLADLRQAYRAQEERAGRRIGVVSVNGKN